MIPGEFTYKRPNSKSEALAMLSGGSQEARAIAGGHSILPMMKLRMATPEVLVDISALSELKGISIGKNIEIGASVTQHEMLSSQELLKACPIISETAKLIADPQIRYCGTIGGNVGNGDPGNDMPALMQCLDATFILENVSGSREVAARDYYQGAYFTSAKAGEIVTKIQFKTPDPAHGFAYQKLKRKVGDYATAAAAVVLEVSKGKVKHASIALTNLADTPLYARAASEMLIGTELNETDIKAAVTAAQAVTAPVEDQRGSIDYKVAMAGVMVSRALQLAKSRAGEAKKGGPLGWLKR